jgi:cysteinyl-tRNA synthetase
MSSRTSIGKALLITFCILLLSALLAGCGGQDKQEPVDENGDKNGITVEPIPLDEVRTWAYQIQGLSEPGAVEALAESPYDMLVVEPTRTDWSSDDRDFDTAGMVKTLKSSPSGDGEHRKLVLAYLDIGEAEDWRWYWDWSLEWEEEEPRPGDWPDYILTRDPDGWEGNYPVAYWDPEWKDIIIYGVGENGNEERGYDSAMDEILKDGFDGVYLDWVEGYEDIEVALEAMRQDLDPADEMVEFIMEIGEYARERNPDFVVVQQNASALGQERPASLEYIDAIAQEAIWFDGEAFDEWDAPDAADMPVEPELTREYLANLEVYMEAGLPVFDCEYAVSQAYDAYHQSWDMDFVPYCTRRSLSRLSATPPWSYREDLSP